MPLGLSDREAAKLVGCSHVAIGEAKKNQRIPILSDGSVTREAVLEWHAGRRAARGGKQRKVTTPDPQVTTRARQIEAVQDQVTGDAETKRIAAEWFAQSDAVFATRAQAELFRDSYAARLKEIEYHLKSGQVVHVADVARAIGEEYAKVRTRLLALPSNLAPRIVHLKSPIEAQAMLMEAVTEALEELVQMPPAEA